MKNTQVKKLNLITGHVLVVGVDVSKKTHTARFIDNQGFELRKRVNFSNNQAGLLSFVEKINTLTQQYGFERTVIGMEPSGHYWEPLAHFLKEYQVKQVFVNPYHVKCRKEMEDNSPDKNDHKDALLVAQQVKEGYFFEMYLPEGVYRELRNLTYERYQLRKKMNNALNRLIALLDRYFPEYMLVSKELLSQNSVAILKSHPFPEDINKLSLDELTKKIKAASNNRMGRKRAEELKRAATVSIGVKEGLDSARHRLKACLEEIEFHQKQLEATKNQMDKQLEKTGYKANLLSIPGVGVVTAARFLGEVGDPMRFEHPNQIINLAGFNLKGNRSGEKQKSEIKITKRGRSELRNLLYQSALILVAKNRELKMLYHYFQTRPQNQLKSKQALVAIANKLVRIMFGLIRKNELYNPDLVLGEVRKAQLGEVA